MDDVKLALLGDRAAQERITARGELLPCHRCKGKPEISSNLRIYSEKPVYFWNIRCTICGYVLDGYGTIYTVLDSGEIVLEDGFDGRQRTIKLWNTRAPILSEEELERLKGEEHGEHQTD